MADTGIGARLAALAEVPERVTCHACRLLDLWAEEDRQGLVVALDTKTSPTKYAASAKAIARAVRASGECLPEADVRLHRRDHK